MSRVYPSGPVVIGIDQSYTGFAITALGEDGHYTQVRPLPGSGVERLFAAQTFVHNFLAYFPKVIAVGMEGYANGAKFGREIAGELSAAVRMGLYEDGFKDVQIVQPSVVKKYATGKGNAKKNEVLLHVYKKWGVEFDDDNAADSYVIARYLWEEKK